MLYTFLASSLKIENEKNITVCPQLKMFIVSMQEFSSPPLCKEKSPVHILPSLSGILGIILLLLLLGEMW